MTVIYCAHPVNDYGTGNEGRRFSTLARLVPEAELLNPAEMFDGTFDWLDRWPRLLGTVDAVVAWGAADGTIGCGVLRELGDATVYRIPTAVLDNAGLWHWSGVDLLDPRHRSAQRVGRLRIGRAVSAARLLAASVWEVTP